MLFSHPPFLLMQKGGYNCWNWKGLLDWTTGLTQTIKKTPCSAKTLKLKVSADIG